MFGDKVHITSAVYSNDDHTLKVSAESGDDSATLKLDGYSAAPDGGERRQHLDASRTSTSRRPTCW